MVGTADLLVHTRLLQETPLAAVLVMCLTESTITVSRQLAVRSFRIKQIDRIFAYNVKEGTVQAHYLTRITSTCSILDMHYVHLGSKSSPETARPSLCQKHLTNSLLHLLMPLHHRTRQCSSLHSFHWSFLLTGGGSCASFAP